MNVDRYLERLGAGEHRREVGVVEELAVDGSVGHAAQEVELAHRVFELVGGGPRLAQRQRGKGAEAIRIGRNDLLGDPGIELAGVCDTLGSRQVLGTRRQGRQDLEVDAGRIHVGDAAGADVVDVEPGHAFRKPDVVEPLQLSGRKMLFQSEQEQVPVVTSGGGRHAGRQRRCRRGGGTGNGGTAQELAPAQGSANRPGTGLIVWVGHDVNSEAGENRGPIFTIWIFTIWQPPAYCDESSL